MAVSAQISFRPWLVALLLIQSGAPQTPQTPTEHVTIHITNLTEERVEARLTHFSKKDNEREEMLRGYFEEAGCTADHVTEQAVPHEKLPNLICVLPGSTDSQIIVGAHFDHANEGFGVVDNWSGAAILPSLIESLAPYPRKHTFVFVGFSGEESGLLGSNDYAKHLSEKDVENIRAMVNLDCVGLDPINVWLSHSDRHLANLYAAVARAENLPLAAVNFDGLADEDSTAFHNRKIPTLVLGSVTMKTLPILHSSRDNISAIKMKDYYNSYLLTAMYLAYIDATLN
jgi:putative aminopeptidase FrvX